jgi:hypothetical protein
MPPAIRIIMLFITLFVAVAGAAQEDIFVDASANNVFPQNGAQNGSAAFPFKTITQALELAREIRFGCPATHVLPSSPHTITIHVASGTYDGAFSASEEPSQETLPLVLNVPNLRLQGALRFKADGTITAPTTLRPIISQRGKQHMVVVTRTNAPANCRFPALFEMAGDFVTISGIFFEGAAASDGTRPARNESALVSVDRVTNFVVKENYFTHGSFGMTARLSSGQIRDNKFVANNGLGVNVSGGSATFPAIVQIVGNQMRENGTFPTAATPNGFGGGVNLQGAAQTQGDLDTLFAAHSFSSVALPATYDRTNHPELVPDTLDVSVMRNTVASNATFGIHVHGYIRDNYELDPGDPNAVMTANVTARFRENVSMQNENYGIVIDAGQIKIDKVRKHVVNISASFHKNTFLQNQSGNALFGFWRFASSVSAAAASDLTLKFAHDSTMTICGDIKQFSFENRETDPTDLTPTNNTLIVNNVLQERISCVPLQNCVHEVPPSPPNCS